MLGSTPQRAVEGRFETVIPTKFKTRRPDKKDHAYPLPRLLLLVPISQLAENLAHNEKVGGSSPSGYIILKRMEQLKRNIIKWAADRGILSKATPASQATKILEECLELVIADYNNDREEIEDACGDIYVTIVIEAHLLGLSLDDVLPTEVDTEVVVNNLDFCTPRSILATATNIFGSVTEDYDIYNTTDRFIQAVYYKLVAYCAQNNVSLKDAVQGAYNIISKRTGRMENGIFVKDN